MTKNELGSCYLNYWNFRKVGGLEFHDNSHLDYDVLS